MTGTSSNGSPPDSGWVPLFAASVRSMRVIEPGYLLTHGERLQDALAEVLHVRSESSFEARLETLVDGFLDAVRRRAVASQLPDFDPGDVVEAVVMGASVAEWERRKSLFKAQESSRFIHALLTLIQEKLWEDCGLTPAVALQAAYIAERAHLPPDSGFAN